jgi:hypothetical protein
MLANGLSPMDFPVSDDDLGLSTLPNGLSRTAALPMFSNGLPLPDFSAGLPNEIAGALSMGLAETPMFANGDAPSIGLGGGVGADDDGVLPHLGTSGTLMSGLVAPTLAKGFLTSGTATLGVSLPPKNVVDTEAASLAGAAGGENERTEGAAGLAGIG